MEYTERYNTVVKILRREIKKLIHEKQWYWKYQLEIIIKQN